MPSAHTASRWDCQIEVPSAHKASTPTSLDVCRSVFLLFHRALGTFLPLCAIMLLHGMQQPSNCIHTSPSRNSNDIHSSDGAKRLPPDDHFASLLVVNVTADEMRERSDMHNCLQLIIKLHCYFEWAKIASLLEWASHGCFWRARDGLEGFPCLLTLATLPPK